MKFARDDKRNRKVQAQISMTPIIDVVLLLLLFFMLSSTFVVQSSIPVEMPEAAGLPEFEQKDISITLTNDPTAPDGSGRIFFDNEEMTDWTALSDRLATVKASRQDDFLVLIRTDESVDSGRMIKLMGIVRSLGISRMGVAALSPGQD
ncbi:MAG: hypothetical protein AMXMBFR84_16010 [Candidatus Hydrogenedentota bacterium]